MAVSNFIDSLRYDPDTILVHKSNDATNYVKEEGYFDPQKPGSYLVIKRKEKTIENGDVSFPYMDAVAARMFPGNLVLVNSALIDNNPSIVSVARKEGAFSIDLPNLSNPNFNSKIDKGSIDGEVSKKIAEWRKAGNTKVGARVDVQFIKVCSSNQLTTSLGLEAKSVSKQLNIDFSAIIAGKSTVWIAKFTQVYFNVFLKQFSSVDELVDDNSVPVEKIVEDLKNKGVSNESPLGVVSSVAYGRQIFVKFESSEHSIDIDSKLRLIIANQGNKLDTTVKAAYQEISSKLTTKAVLYGGTADGGAQLLQSVTVENFYETVVKNLSFGDDNVAVPIAYGVSFVKNGGQKLATVHSTTTYVETETYEYNRGHIHIYQGGSFVAFLYITWNEISYEKGNPTPKITGKSWDRNGKDCCVWQSYDIELPGNARNLHITVKGYTGILWDRTRTSFDRDVTITPNVNVDISGTTLNQKCSVKV